MSNLKVTYIASSFVSAYRITNFKPESEDGAEYVRMLDELWWQIPTNVFEIGILFNALTEKAKANHPYLESLYQRGMRHIHADSGGLQAITLKKDVTPELKEQIYTTQSNYSTYAMCFDEIPVRSGKNDSIITPERYYDPAMLDECAIKTGNNINEQIEVFKKNPNNRSKVLLILQGNCVESYTRWANLIWETIKPENREYIGGLALGHAALKGTNYNMMIILNAIARSNIPREYCSVIHLLGVGNSDIFMPVYSLLQSPLFDFVKELTFDSTTHTKSYIYGSFSTPYRNLVKGGRNVIGPLLDFLKEMYSDYIKVARGKFIISEEEFIENYKRYIMYNKIGNKTPEDIETSAFYSSIHVIYCIRNFSYYLKNIIDEKLPKQQYYIFRMMREVKTIEDLEHVMEICYHHKSFNTDHFEIYKEVPTIEDFL